MTGIFSATCVALALAGCAAEGVKTLGDYFDAKSDYAVVLNDWLSQNNPNWRVIPIYGPIYEPGMPMEPGSTEPLTDACRVPPEQIVTDDMASFPRVKASRTFNLSGNVPAAVAKARDVAVAGGARFGSTSEYVLDYKDLSQRAVRRDVFDQNLMRPECLAVIAGKEVTIVRGQIIGRETISSTKTLSIGANASILGDEALKMSYDSSGGFELEDTEAQAKYFYVVNRTIIIDGLPPNATMRMRRAAVEDFLRTETTGELQVVDRPPSDSDIEAFVRLSQANSH